MKVVLFCGGLGMRLREYSETLPKPMVNIGYRPIIWHLMKYYAHYGHTDFILCLGYRGDAIKEYFLNYDECLSNDFVLSGGGKNVTLHARDIEDWTITFVDTGSQANIGQRLVAVRRHVENEEIFLANYTDQLSDLPLDHYIDDFRRRDKLAGFVSVRPNHTFHVVSVGDDNLVKSVRHVSRAGLWINGGFFAFRPGVFDYIEEGEELVEEPFNRLIRDHQLLAFKHTGFWACMDTFKDKQRFDTLYATGNTPWEVWKPPATVAAAPAPPPRLAAVSARRA